MCHRVTCRTCKKPTYRGCGMHVEQVLAGVPKSQRCSCDLLNRTLVWDHSHLRRILREYQTPTTSTGLTGRWTALPR